MRCIECGKSDGHEDGIWHPGFGCLYGMLAVCSRACAKAFAERESRYGELREEDLEFVEGENIIEVPPPPYCQCGHPRWSHITGRCGHRVSKDVSPDYTCTCDAFVMRGELS